VPETMHKQLHLQHDITMFRVKFLFRLVHRYQRWKQCVRTVQFLAKVETLCLTLSLQLNDMQMRPE
jgi:hypothetical protein